MNKYEHLENIFIPMLIESAEELRSGKMSKGRFIGKYTQALNKVDKENAFRFKSPQFLSYTDDPTNNWVDQIISMPEDEYYWFMAALCNQMETESPSQ